MSAQGGSAACDQDYAGYGEILESLTAERDRYRVALQDIEPLVVDLAERGWIKGAEAVLIVQEALRG